MIFSRRNTKERYSMSENPFLTGVGLLFDFGSTEWQAQTVAIRNKSVDEALCEDGQAVVEDLVKAYATEIDNVQK